MKAIFSIITILFSLGSAHGQAQFLLHGNATADLMKKANAFDSLIVFNRPSNIHSRLIMMGYGYKKQECIAITVVFEQTKSGLSVKQIKASKEQVNLLVKDYLKTVFKSLPNLNADSLLANRSSFSTDHEILLAQPKLNRSLLLQSFDKQKGVPTKDQSTFFAIVERLKGHIQ